jgi:2-oxoglutarate ferredoxin oxidoreductase subunit alpha
VNGPSEGDLVILGWGSTFGAIAGAVRELEASGSSVAQVHLRHLNPLPPDLGAILARYRRVLVPEMNLGQLVRLIRAEYLIDAVGLNKIQGRPFKVSEIVARSRKLLEEVR